MINKLFIVCSIAGSMAWALPSSSIINPKAKVLSKKNYSINLELDYWQSTGTYDIDGNEQDFTGTNAYERYEASLGFRYGISDKLEMMLGVRARENRSTTESGTTTTELSKNGFESVVASLKYGTLHEGKYYYGVEAGVRQTVFSQLGTEQANSTIDIELGDESTTFFFDAEFSALITKGLIAQLEIGAAFPSAPQSDEIYYDVGAAWVFSRAALIGGVEGVHSLENDEYTDTPLTKPALPTGNTNMINSINRSYMAPYIGINFAFNNTWRAELKGLQTRSGQYWDSGRMISFNLVYTKDNKYDTKKKVKSFKEYAFDASIIKISPRGKFVKIDKGLSSDLKKGMKVDIYDFDYLGGNELLASGVIYEVNVSDSIVRLNKRYNDKDIKIGNVARGK